MTLVLIIQDLVFEGPTPKNKAQMGSRMFQVQKILKVHSFVNHQTSSTNPAPFDDFSYDSFATQKSTRNPQEKVLRPLVTRVNTAGIVPPLPRRWGLQPVDPLGWSVAHPAQQEDTKDGHIWKESPAFQTTIFGVSTLDFGGSKSWFRFRIYTNLHRKTNLRLSFFLPETHSKFTPEIHPEMLIKTWIDDWYIAFHPRNLT